VNGNYCVPVYRLLTYLGRIPPVGLVLIGIISVQLGAAISKSVFDDIGPTLIVWLRLATSAAVLALIARPSWRGRSAQDWWVAVGLGVTLAGMNWTFYQAIAQIPLGIAVTIEFIGPLTVAALGSRRPRHFAWVGLAGAGVALEPGRLTVAGVGLALLAGVMWGGYIVLSAQTGARWPGLSGLAVASVIACALLSAPMAIATRELFAPLVEPRLLAIGVLIGLLSSVVPYSAEIAALRTMSTASFGIVMSLEPAAAALAAAIVLGELLTPLQLVAMTCVVVASIGATRSATRDVPPVTI
jgi:inner membrane transporter RhtA